MSVVLKQLLDVRLIITLPDACNKFGEERRPLRRASGETARYITNIKQVTLQVATVYI